MYIPLPPPPPVSSLLPLFPPPCSFSCPLHRPPLASCSWLLFLPPHGYLLLAARPVSVRPLGHASFFWLLLLLPRGYQPASLSWLRAACSVLPPPLGCYSFLRMGTVHSPGTRSVSVRPFGPASSFWLLHYHSLSFTVLFTLLDFFTRLFSQRRMLLMSIWDG